MRAFTSKSHCDHHPIRQTNDRPPPLPHPHYLGHAKRKPKSSESMVSKSSFSWTDYYNVTNVTRIHRVITSFSFKNPSLFSSKSVSNLSFSPSRNSWRKINDNFTKWLALKYRDTYINLSYCIYFLRLPYLDLLRVLQQILGSPTFRLGFCLVTSLLTEWLVYAWCVDDLQDGKTQHTLFDPIFRHHWHQQPKFDKIMVYYSL